MASRRDQPSQSGYQSRSAYESRERVNGTMGPPPIQSTHPDRTGYITSSASGNAAQQNTRPHASAPRTNQSQEPGNQYNENPARLALINDDETSGHDRRRDATLPGKDSRGARDGRDERTLPDNRSGGGRATPTESPRELQPRADQPSDLAPTGPRRGRLSRDFSAQGAQESSYGRLNGPQDALSSGPRPPNGPSGRVSRGFPAPQAPASARSNEPPLPSPSATQPPDYPSALRGPDQRQTDDRRNSGSQYERQASSNSVPTTPASESGPSVHPSRLNQLGMPPPPIQTDLPANGSRNAGSPTTAPPSGPRGPNRPPAGTPTGPSPSMNGPPSGPASAVERQRRSNRQRADINATLQGANHATGPNGPIVSFRGAAQNRQPSVSMSSAVNAPPVQAIASAIEPPSRHNEPPPARQEAPPSRPESRPELFQSKPDRGGEPDSRASRRKEEDERADLQRTSRHPSRDRRPDDEPPQRPPPPGMDDSRNKRSDARDERRPRDERSGRDGPPQRELRGPERSQRNEDLQTRRPPPPEAPGSFSGPPPNWTRGSERLGPRREGHDDSRRGGRMSGRPEDFRGGPREEQRRDGGRASRDDGPPPLGGRKRRHEDAPFDEAKRRRSGR